MSNDSTLEVTQLLQRMNAGDPHAPDELFGFLYPILHERAAVWMEGQSPDHTLQATALLHEAYIRLVAPRSEPWKGRAHFLSVASKAMRCVLVDHARAKGRQKRKTPGKRLPLDQVTASYEDAAFDLLKLDEALKSLASFDAKMAEAVDLRLFGGLSIDETATILEMSKRTFERNWTATRAWLMSEVI